MESVSEQALVRHLISSDTWVRLEDLRVEGKEKVSKEVLDRMVNLGLIIRTLVDGQAAARIVSPLFSEWVRRCLSYP